MNSFLKYYRNVKHPTQPVDHIVNIPGIKCDFTKPADIVTAAPHCYHAATTTGYAEYRTND